MKTRLHGGWPRCLCVAVLALAALPLHAQLFRTYVASTGSDANPCTIQKPCRLLPAAISAVASGGEVWILDSANFNTGTVVVGKSVTIQAIPGQLASVVAMGGPAIQIATPGVDVVLRNLSISNNAATPGTHGIHMTAGNSLTVEDSVIANTVATSIRVTGTSAAVRIRNTVIRNSSYVPVEVFDGPALEIVGCRFIGNASGGVGVYSTASGMKTTADITDTVISGRSRAVSSGSGGVLASAVAGSTARINLSRSTIYNVMSALGASGAGTATVTVSDSMAVHNHWNVFVGSGGVVRSLGNNHLSDAEAGDTGSLTSMPPT